MSYEKLVKGNGLILSTMIVVPIKAGWLNSEMLQELSDRRMRTEPKKYTIRRL